jgi:hypothetical protein
VGLATDSKPAQAWTSNEHATNIPHNQSSQSAANTWCKNTVNYQISWQGGNFTDVAHGGIVIFANFLPRPYVWGHMSQNRCVINGTPAAKYGGHP